MSWRRRVLIRPTRWKNLSASWPRRAIWIMLPAGAVTQGAIESLIPLLNPGDTIIDGGNTNFNDDIRRAAMLEQHGPHYIDQGTSGGIWGLENGYCIMVGGETELVKRLEPAFVTLAPPDGYVHCGPIGSGHFVKMIHNGVAYGMMQAYAEGFEIMRVKQDFNLSICMRSPRRGATAAWYARGCSIWPKSRCVRPRIYPTLKVTSRTAVKVAGRSKRPSILTYLHRSLHYHCSSGSIHAGPNHLPQR